jgi:hypothetical protein
MILTHLPATAVLVALTVFASCASLGTGEAGAPPGDASRSGRRLPRLRDIALKGDLGTRYDAAICNLLTRHDRYSIDSYRSSAAGTPGALWWDWPGDQFGRMLSVLQVAEGLGWAPAQDLRRAIGDAVLPLQTAPGYFGPEKGVAGKDVRLISGNAFALRGLLDAYEDTREERYLAAARKLGRYFESAFDAWKGPGEKGPVHEFYGHCLDGLVRLQALGGDPWALDLARRIGARAGRTKHTHHSLSLYRGLIELSRATGDPTFLAPLEDYLAWCRERRIVTGALPETMPANEQDEGCGLADAIVVNLMAFAGTGSEDRLDDAEHLLVNGFAMNQFRTGGFGHRGFAPDVIGGKGWQGWEGRFGSENPGCCSLWGAFALGRAAQHIVTRDGEAVEVNLYPAAAIDLPDLAASIVIASDYPRMRSAAITVRPSRPTRFPLRLRVPRWAEGVEARLNGGEAGAVRSGSRLVLDREWRSGDRVELTFAGSLRLVPWPDAGSDRAAVFDGPLCLGLPSVEADPGEWTELLVDSGGRLVLSPDGRPQAVRRDGGARAGLRPIGSDWQAPDVANPNRWRVLFRLRKSG